MHIVPSHGNAPGPDARRGFVRKGDDGYRIYFDYDPSLVSATRDLSRDLSGGLRFIRDELPPFWLWAAENPTHRDLDRLMEFASIVSFGIEQSAIEAIQGMRGSIDATPVASARYDINPVLSDDDSIGWFLVNTGGYSPEKNAVIRDSGQAVWSAREKLWRLTYSASSVDSINTLVDRFGLTIDPVIAVLVSHKQADMARALDMSSSPDSTDHFPSPPGLVYKGYQKSGIAYALEKTNVLIGDEPGLGKTIQAIGIANALGRTGVGSVLIIVPASLKTNWSREWAKWDVDGRTIGVVRDGKPESWPTDADVVIINYDLLGRQLDRIHGRRWDMLVIDEAHNIKNPKAQRSVYILGGKIGNVEYKKIDAVRRLYLTGTPLTNRPVEIWPLAHSLAPERFSDFFRFAKRFCNATHNGFGWDFSGASNLGELQSELRVNCMVRRLKADVLDDLPSKTRQIVRVGDGPPSHEKSMLLAMASASELDAQKILAYLAGDKKGYEKAVRNLKKISASLSIDEISRLRKKTALLKIPYIQEIVSNITDSNQKVILFTHHHEVTDALAEFFGNKAVVVDGRTKNEDRQAFVDHFQTDPDCMVFIGGIHAAGVGLTLTEASTVVFAEIDWVPGIMTQAEDRAHRIGQKNSVLIMHIVMDGSIDSMMIDQLVDKQAVLDCAMDNPVEIARAEIHDAPHDDAPVGHNVQTATDTMGGAASIVIPDSVIDAWLSDRAPVNRQSHRADTTIQQRGFSGEDCHQLTDVQVDDVHQKLKRLAFVCDGAMARDRRGFNAADATIGRVLAGLEHLNQIQAAYGAEMLKKYARQVGPVGSVDGESHTTPEDGDNERKRRMR